MNSPDQLRGLEIQLVFEAACCIAMLGLIIGVTVAVLVIWSDKRFFAKRLRIRTHTDKEDK